MGMVLGAGRGTPEMTRRSKFPKLAYELGGKGCPKANCGHICKLGMLKALVFGIPLFLFIAEIFIKRIS